MAMADRIRTLVKKHPKSRQQIADELYISIDCLGNYITGRRSPDAAMIRQLAIYFQVSADYILCVVPSMEEAFMQSPADQEQNLLDLFRIMTPMQREFFLHSGYGIIQNKSSQEEILLQD